MRVLLSLALASSIALAAPDLDQGVIKNTAVSGSNLYITEGRAFNTDVTHTTDLSQLTTNQSSTNAININTNKDDIAQNAFDIAGNSAGISQNALDIANISLTPGPKGDTGATGAAGQNGTNGTDGIDGQQGIQGIQGIAGQDGTNGTDGVDGNDGGDGKPGADGQDGADGATGATGATGSAGTNGTDGSNGLDGKDGVDGNDGTDGAAGTDGNDGAKGDTGNSGTDGSDGSDGTDGDDGVDGADGKDGEVVGLDAYKEQMEQYQVSLQEASDYTADTAAGGIAVSAIDFGTVGVGETEIGMGVGYSSGDFSYMSVDSFAGAIGIKHGLTEQDAAIGKAWYGSNGGYAIGAGLTHKFQYNLSHL